MTFPDYIPTRTVTAGKAFALETAAPLPVKISVRASRSLIWGATGYRFEAVGAAATGEGFDEASLELPVTDLNGWRDANTRAEIEISEEGFQTHSHTYSADVTVGSKTYKIGPFVLPSGTGDIDLDLVVPTGTEAGSSVLIPDEWSRIASEAAEEARKAAEDARSAADDAQAVLTQDAATAWGFYPVYSHTPPEETEMFGVPVLWIDPTEEAFPTPILPPAPVWNDFNSTFTVPSGVVGVHYTLTSGTGQGATLTPGSTHSTSGSYPRTVVVTPVAKPGYVLASGIERFKHDFPDPADITLMFSEGFSGDPGDTLSGRPLDMAHGGLIPISWQETTGQSWVLSESGTALSNGVASRNVIPLNGENSALNLRIEFDIVSFANPGNYGSQSGLTVSIVTPGASEGQALLSLFGAAGTGNIQVAASNGKGGLTPFTNNVPYRAGTWALQVFGTSMTVTSPDGINHVFDASDNSRYKLPTDKLNKNIIFNSSPPPLSVAIDNIKVYKIGY